MKSPAVIHFRCLDTFGLRDVARTYGSGGAGVRLTHDGLAAYVRPSRQTPVPEKPVAVNDEPRVARTDETRSPRVADVVLQPPPAPRASMPSLVTIEMGLRKPTTWAVLLLTLGVAFGVAIARVASRGPSPDAAAPIAAIAPVAPRADVDSIVFAPHAVRADAPAPMTISPTTIVAGARASHVHARAASSSVASSAPASEPAAGVAIDNAKSDPGDQAAAAAADERVRRELSDSL